MPFAEISNRLDFANPTARRLCERPESHAINQSANDGKSCVPGSRLRLPALREAAERLQSTMGTGK